MLFVVPIRMRFIVTVTSGSCWRFWSTSPNCNRPFALPILVALYRSKDTNKQEGRRHKTPVELTCGLLAVLMHCFPEKRFVFAGDGSYGTHQMARFAYRHRQRLGLVSKFVPDANLFAAPPKGKRDKRGRPAIKGKALPKPQEIVARSKGKLKLLVSDSYLVLSCYLMASQLEFHRHTLSTIPLFRLYSYHSCDSWFSLFPPCNPWNGWSR